MKTLQSSRMQHLAAAERVMTYLLSRDDTMAVSRCEEDDIYCDPTCTLTWFFAGPDKVTPIKVLVRGDRFNNGHLYFETSANQTDTPGGSPVLDSTATYLFYFFLTTGELYIIPLPEFREWVMMNIDSFEPRKVAREEGGEYVVELGRLVPLSYVDTFPRATKLQI